MSLLGNQLHIGPGHSLSFLLLIDPCKLLLTELIILRIRVQIIAEFPGQIGIISEENLDQIRVEFGALFDPLFILESYGDQIEIYENDHQIERVDILKSVLNSLFIDKEDFLQMLNAISINQEILKVVETNSILKGHLLDDGHQLEDSVGLKNVLFREVYLSLVDSVDRLR